jgi:hypothetical protein
LQVNDFIKATGAGDATEAHAAKMEKYMLRLEQQVAALAGKAKSSSAPEAQGMRAWADAHMLAVLEKVEHEMATSGQLYSKQAAFQVQQALIVGLVTGVDFMPSR